MNNMRIRTKLRAALAVLALMTIALGVFSIDRMGAINAQSTLIAERFVPRAYSLSVIIKWVNRYRLAEGNHIGETTPERMASVEQRLVDVRKEADQELARFGEFSMTDDYREIADKLGSGWERYLALSEAVLELSRRDEKKQAFEDWIKARTAFEEFMATIMTLAETNSAHSVDASHTAASAFSTSRIVVIAILAVTALMFLAIALFFDRAVGRAIETMTNAMTRLAQDDLAVVIPGTERGDEIGAMARAVEVFREGAKTRKSLEAKELREQAERQRRMTEMDRMIRAFESSVAEALKTVATAAVQVEGTAKGIKAIANDSGREATASASAAEQTSHNVQTVATAAEEMNCSLQEIAHQIARASEIVVRAVTEAQSTNTTIRGLADASDRIGEVVSLIADIAAQTNLLALNATIEAARAGDLGKGFAVVAAEVKTLATRTSRATDDIAKQIASMQGATQQAVNAIESIGSTIVSINDITTAISAAVEEQSAATGEIARNVTHAAAGTQEVCDNVVRLSTSAQRTGDAANELEGAAAALSRQSSELRGEVEQFLGGIRAA